MTLFFFVCVLYFGASGENKPLLSASPRVPTVTLSMAILVGINGLLLFW